MVRTTITLPEELLQRLKRIAAERDVPMAVVIREALEEKAAEERAESTEPEEPKERAPKLSFIGAFDSGYTDTSELASDRSIYKPRSWR